MQDGTEHSQQLTDTRDDYSERNSQLQCQPAARQQKSRPRTILSSEQVIEIFEQKKSMVRTSRTTAPSADLARKYHVSSKTIRDIWNGRCWQETTKPLRRQVATGRIHSRQLSDIFSLRSKATARTSNGKSSVKRSELAAFRPKAATAPAKSAQSHITAPAPRRRRTATDSRLRRTARRHPAERTGPRSPRSEPKDRLAHACPAPAASPGLARRRRRRPPPRADTPAPGPHPNPTTA